MTRREPGSAGRWSGLKPDFASISASGDAGPHGNGTAPRSRPAARPAAPDWAAGPAGAGWPGGGTSSRAVPAVISQAGTKVWSPVSWEVIRYYSVLTFNVAFWPAAIVRPVGCWLSAAPGGRAAIDYSDARTRHRRCRFYWLAPHRRPAGQGR